MDRLQDITDFSSHVYNNDRKKSKENNVCLCVLEYIVMLYTLRNVQ